MANPEEENTDDEDVAGIDIDDENEKEIKKHSRYWIHFEEITVNGDKFARCKLCFDIGKQK